MTLQFAFCNFHFAMLYSRRCTTAPNKVFTLRFACPSGNPDKSGLREYKLLVFKVNKKNFVMVNLSGETQLTVKCNPELAIELREKYQAVQPGYHMNKRHWNTINIDGSLPDKLILKWVDHSYKLVTSRNIK